MWVKDGQAEENCGTPSREQWTQLYEVADLLKILAPWQTLWDTHIITIQLPNRDEPIFCSVMGHGGSCYGIGIYPGYDSFARLSRLMSSGGSSGINAFEQRCLMCYYGDREEIEPKDRLVMQELGLKFRGRNQWIYFRAMEPGFFPWFLNAEQAELMTDALQNLAMACKYIMSKQLQVNFEAGETLLRLYSEEREEWLNSVSPIPQIPLTQNHWTLQDEQMVSKLKKQKKGTAALELDSFYLPAPIRENKDDIPRLPQLTLLADRKEGILLSQHLTEPEEQKETIALKLLLNFVMENNRPAALYVRDDEMAGVLKGVCDQIGIRLVIGKGMRATDAFFLELFDSMTYPQR